MLRDAVDARPPELGGFVPSLMVALLPVVVDLRGQFVDGDLVVDETWPQDPSPPGTTLSASERAPGREREKVLEEDARARHVVFCSGCPVAASPVAPARYLTP